MATLAVYVCENNSQSGTLAMDDFEEFFVCCINDPNCSDAFNSNTADKKMEEALDDVDDYDRFFYCCMEDAEEAGNETYEELQTGQKKSNKRKSSNPRKSFKQHQAEQASVDNIKKQVEAFQSCCARMCFSWITWQMVLYCRALYVLLPCFDERRAWLCSQFERMESTGRGYMFQMDVQGQRYDSEAVCGDACRLAYGIPRATRAHKRQLFTFKNNTQY